MTNVHFIEVLPEGDHAAWVTLSDGQTRLIDLRLLQTLHTHHALRLRRLIRRPRLTTNGQHVTWPGGAVLDTASVLDAPHGSLPVILLSTVPAAQRYRPLEALLRHAEPPTHDYLEVRPDHVIRTRLGLTQGDLSAILEWHRPVPPELVLARLSDLMLLLSSLLPDMTLPALLRSRWPYAQRHHPDSRLLETALACLRAGRIDLVEAPLATLFLAPPSSAFSMDRVHVAISRQHAAAPNR